jgi:hypothetical protein
MKDQIRMNYFFIKTYESSSNMGGGGGVVCTIQVGLCSVCGSFQSLQYSHSCLSYLFELILPVHNDNISLGIQRHLGQILRADGGVDPD